MHQHKGGALANPGFKQQIQLPRFLAHNINKQFLLQKTGVTVIQLAGEFWQKQFEKFCEKSLQQLFERFIMGCLR
ncbi:hypothetical protein D3C75_218300 [compost metagenome]